MERKTKFQVMVNKHKKYVNKMEYYRRYITSVFDDDNIGAVVLFFIPFGLIYLCFYRPIKKLISKHKLKIIEVEFNAFLDEVSKYLKKKIPFYEKELSNFKEELFKGKEFLYCNEKMKKNYVTKKSTITISDDRIATSFFNSYGLENLPENAWIMICDTFSHDVTIIIEREISKNKGMYKNYELTVDKKDSRLLIELKYEGEDYSLKGW